MLSIPSKPIQWDLETRDPDQVRSVVSQFLTQYRLDTFLNKNYDARLLSRRFTNTSLNLIEYGDRAGVGTDVFESFAAIHMPVRGSFQTGRGKYSTSVSAGEAQILFPDRAFELDCSPDCCILVVRFDDPLILALMQDIQSNYDTTKNPSVLSLTHGVGRTLGHLVNLFTEEFTDSHVPGQNPKATQHAEKLLRECVISILQEKISGKPVNKPIVPDYVRQVELYIHRHVGKSASLLELVKVSGVSERTLNYGFKKTHGIGPISWSRQLRLNKAHGELLTSDPRITSVTEIALNWGFNHLGRFSENYFRAYGEYPSETLRRRVIK